MSGELEVKDEPPPHPRPRGRFARDDNWETGQKTGRVEPVTPATHETAQTNKHTQNLQKYRNTSNKTTVFVEWVSWWRPGRCGRVESRRRPLLPDTVSDPLHTQGPAGQPRRRRTDRTDSSPWTRAPGTLPTTHRETRWTSVNRLTNKFHRQLILICQ